MDVVVGVDVGTTSAKAVAAGADAQVVAVASDGYALRVPQPGRAELDAHEVAEAARRVTVAAATAAREDGHRVVGVAVSAAMHGLVALDDDGSPRGPLLTWADGRAGRQARDLRGDDLGPRLHERSGAPIHPMLPLLKLRWLADTEGADAVRRVPWWGGVKELVLSALCGARAVDLSSACASGLVDARAADWDDEALDVAGLDADQLAPVVATTEVVGHLHGDLVRRAGLDGDVPVVAGATDGVLGNLGTGAVTPDVGAVSLGTSGALRSVRPDFDVDDRHRLFCYALLPDLWVVGGAVNNAGSVVRWATRALGGAGAGRRRRRRGAGRQRRAAGRRGGGRPAGLRGAGRAAVPAGRAGAVVGRGPVRGVAGAAPSPRSRPPGPGRDGGRVPAAGAGPPGPGRRRQPARPGPGHRRGAEGRPVVAAAGVGAGAAGGPAGGHRGARPPARRCSATTRSAACRT